MLVFLFDVEAEPRPAMVPLDDEGFDAFWGCLPWDEEAPGRPLVEGAEARDLRLPLVLASWAAARTLSDSLSVNCVSSSSISKSSGGNMVSSRPCLLQ